MEKEKEAMRKERMNDRGFSLVELIIVIAIMAILIVVLAPQYLRYVERSRNSTDMQNARTLMTAIETWAADPQANSNFGGDGETVTITITQQGTTPASKIEVSAGGTAGTDALTATGLDLNDIHCSSRTAWTQYVITGTVQASGAIDWAFAPQEFEDAMTGQTTPATP